MTPRCRQMDTGSEWSDRADRRVRAEGEGEMRPTRSLLLGVSVGLFGVLVVLVMKYVAVVLTG